MRRLLTALPALALVAGCGLLYAEIEIPDAAVTLKGQTFAGTPVGVPLVKDVSFDIGNQITLLKEKNVSFELRLTELEVVLTATSPMGDFGAIQSVTLTVLPPPGQTMPEATVIASYQKPPPPAPQNPTSVTVAAMSNLDLAPYLAAGVLALRIRADSSIGAIPDWNADVTGHFYVLARFDYGKRL